MGILCYRVRLFIRQNLPVCPGNSSEILLLFFSFIAPVRTIGPHEYRRHSLLLLKKYVNVILRAIFHRLFAGFEWHFQIKISMNAFPPSFDENPINVILCCLGVQKHCIVLLNFSCWQSRRERGFVRFRKGFRCRAGTLDKLLRKNLLLRDLYARVLVMTVVVIVTMSLQAQVRSNR